MEHRELYEKLNRLISQLPEQQQVIFRMIKENGLTAKQTAKILQLSPRTVETHIYKAVKRLEEEITGYLGYSPKKKTVNRMITLAL
jgi:RNA polymerase sigma-70 factor (ECF subfamily)